MQSEESIARLKKLTGESSTDLIELLLEDAEEFVLAYTNRTYMIPALEKPKRDLALISYNRMGTEGETGRSEAGESYSFDSAPKHIYDILKRYRLVRCGGRAHEKKQYGNRINYIKNCKVEGKYKIIEQDGKIIYRFNGFSLCEGDGICLYSGKEKDPDYQIISIKPYQPIYIEVEKI